MIRCLDNQINASFIDISIIKWLVFLLWSSFFRTTSTVASSEAPADYQPAPGRTDGIPERHQRQWIISPSLQICAWNFNRTCRGIKGLGKNPFTHSIPFHSIHIPWRQCLLSGGTEACSLGLRETPVYTRHPTFVTATSGVLTQLPAWLSKNRMRVYTLSDMRSKNKIACIHGLRSEGVKVPRPNPGLFIVSNNRVNATRNGFIHRLTSLYNSILPKPTLVLTFFTCPSLLSNWK